MDNQRYIEDQCAPGTTGALLSITGGPEVGELTERASRRSRLQRLGDFAASLLFAADAKVRERLRRAIESFPERVPFFFEKEQDCPERVKSRTEACEVWAALADPANWKRVRTSDRAAELLIPQIPEALQDKLRADQEARHAVLRDVGMCGWAVQWIKQGELGESFSPEDALALAQERARADDVNVPPAGFEEETRVNAIALVAAALVTRHLAWAHKEGHLEWCREQLLRAATRPEPAKEVDIPESRYPWGFRRSAARALPALLLIRGTDGRVRQAILSLASHRHNEVRDYLFLALRDLWLVAPRLLWACMARGAACSLLPPRDMGMPLAHRLAQAAWWRLRQGILRRTASPRPFEALLRLSPGEMDLTSMSSVLLALPGPDADLGQRISRQITSVLRALVGFTSRAHRWQIEQELHEESHGVFTSERYTHAWDAGLAHLLARWVLPGPSPEAEQELLRPILGAWPDSAPVLEQLLHCLLLRGCDPPLDADLVTLWPRLASAVLDSEFCDELPYHIEREACRALGLLIFADDSIKWRAAEWPRLRELTDVVDHWCAKVGHHRDCFPSLIKLVLSMGMPLFVDHGLDWLTSCLGRSDRRAELLDDVGSPLAEVLHRAWYQHSDALRRDARRFGPFVRLVHELAAQEVALAVQLQRELRE